MRLPIAAQMGSVAIVSALFAAGCMGDEDTRNKVELGTSNGTTDDQATGDQNAKPNPVERVVTVTKLASDQKGVAPNLVPSLVNAWGMAVLNQNFWIAANGTGDVPILNGKGVPSAGPPASGAIHLEKGITGVTETGAGPDDDAFQIHTQTDCRPAQLVFVSETGRIFATNTELSTTQGFLVADFSKEKANFKGVAMLETDRGPLILAADFRNARIVVLDSDFKQVSSPSFDIAKSLPAGPKGARFAPFNVMTTNDRVFIAFALQDEKKQDAVAGKGLGFVAELDKTGHLIALAKGPELNAPWGMVVTCNFAPARNALLVGNFGDGRITALDLHTMISRGQLETEKGKPVMIDGLWDLNFGVGVQDARPNELFFTAGPDHEKHGLFGVIRAASEKEK